MSASIAQRRDHLRLVARNRAAELPLVVTDPAARGRFEQLTEPLIEMMDLIDGDCDVEGNGDEYEDGDEV